jgi:hypothetical protein
MMGLRSIGSPFCRTSAISFTLGDLCGMTTSSFSLNSEDVTDMRFCSELTSNLAKSRRQSLLCCGALIIIGTVFIALLQYTWNEYVFWLLANHSPARGFSLDEEICVNE